ncbi:uncharacterized protein TNCT_578721 [Trichonephila clavata]|uniref:Uncharacterized protein n=1 Tax=Trichonephila clavata TaxID=2740835 RepID=A0A8X6H1V7_TRICU|nr:uncharacterized protein TNCT_578721 [Trichonephila clavata]
MPLRTMQKHVLFAVLIKAAIHILLLSGYAFARNTPWKNLALNPYSNQIQESYNSLDDPRGEDVKSLPIADEDLADFELEDLVKRMDDDYGHMRFGRSNVF